MCEIVMCRLSHIFLIGGRTSTDCKVVHGAGHGVHVMNVDIP